MFVPTPMPRPKILISIICFSSCLTLGEIITDKEEINQGSHIMTNHEIKNKIDKISNTLLNYSSATNRRYILNNLENKLRRASDRLDTKDKKRIQFIMKGIRLKVLNETKYNNEKPTLEESTTKEVEEKEENLKHEMVTEISNRIESLIENEINYFNTSRNIENNFTDSINVKQNEIVKDYSISNKSKRILNHEFNLTNSGDDKNDYLSKDSINIDNTVNIKNNFIQSSHLKKPQFCRDFINRTCEDLKNMNRLKCRYEQSYITLDKLCDGNPDCPFESDEKNCYSQVMERFFYVKQIKRNMESFQYLKCFQFDTNSFVLINQAKKLQDVLEKGLNFESKDNINLESFDESNNNGQVNKEENAKHKGIANNIALVISSLALALDGALCSNKPSKFDTRRSKNLLNIDLFEIDLDKDFRQSVNPTKYCKCQNQFCSNCTYYCKRLCRQKYSLTNWNCENINGTTTIPLDFLCDGKSDCYDESDEDGCSAGAGYAKFKASEMYSYVLRMLQLKASKQRQPILKKFLLLSDSISRLQKLTMESMPEKTKIKKLRDKCYSILRSIYSDIVKSLDIGKEPEEAYLFLLAINQNLGTALKRSHTGNAKVMGNRCHCRNGACTTLFCSKICSKACTVEHKLTRYYCYGKSNKSVSLAKICNGVNDCRNGYDEFNCRKDEICRHHHLVLLMRNLQSVGENLKGTALGEVLSSWKAKVISSIKVLEKTERPIPHVLKKAVENILQDLVFTYGSLENYRRSTTSHILGQFMNISQMILEAIKSCRK